MKLMLVRVTGIEPVPQAWEAHVLPLNYTRIQRNQDLHISWWNQDDFFILMESEIILKRRQKILARVGDWRFDLSESAGIA